MCPLQHEAWKLAKILFSIAWMPNNFSKKKTSGMNGEVGCGYDKSG